MITTVNRFHLHEIEKAVAELEQRGFEVIYPITEVTKIGSTSSSFNYTKNRYTNRQANMSSGYIAKLRIGE